MELRDGVGNNPDKDKPPRHTRRMRGAPIPRGNREVAAGPLSVSRSLGIGPHFLPGRSKLVPKGEGRQLVFFDASLEREKNIQFSNIH